MLKAIKFMPIKSGLWTPFSQKWLVQSRFHFYLTRSHMYVHKCLTYTLLFMLPYYLLKSKVQLALPVFECLVSFPYDKVWSRQHSIQQLFKLGSGVACSRFVTHISGGYGIWPEIKQEGKRFRRDSQRRLSQKERSLHFKFKVRALNHWSAIRQVHFAISAQFVNRIADVAHPVASAILFLFTLTFTLGSLCISAMFSMAMSQNGDFPIAMQKPATHRLLLYLPSSEKKTLRGLVAFRSNYSYLRRNGVG